MVLLDDIFKLLSMIMFSALGLNLVNGPSKFEIQVLGSLIFNPFTARKMEMNEPWKSKMFTKID